MLTPLPLPPLSAEEAAHSARVTTLIRRDIDAAGGWVPFSRFMQLALYAPGLGYYSAGSHKLGAGGDYITAPELTPLFARCMAAQIARLLHATGGGDVLEAGAGSGALAADLLEALAGRGASPRRYLILEVSAPLRERQRATLAARAPGVAARVQWIDAPPAEAWRGVVVANEVLDALPVERFRATDRGIESIGVVAGGEGFVLAARPAAAEIVASLSARLGPVLAALPPGYESEWSPLLGPWIAEMSRFLECGGLLLADYGLPRSQYYHASRTRGSVTAFFRHRQIEDVLARPGLQDITAWVDFTAVAEAAAGNGLEVAGFTTQAHFLLSTGLERELAAAGVGLDGGAQARLAQAASTLMLPGEMGERCKVMLLTRGVANVADGFAFRDLAATL